MYKIMRSNATAKAVFRAFLALALITGGLVVAPARTSAATTSGSVALGGADLSDPGLVDRAAAAGAANDHTVLILGTTVSGTPSIEATAATAAGLSVEIADAAGWAAKSTADFATYRAIVLGDATCGGSAAAAQANTAVWGPAVNGRIIIIGSDPVYHSASGGRAFTTGAVQFVAGEATKTGAYITLSCYYHGVAEHTPVPLLDAFAVGGFTVRGVGCYNNAHIVASSPALTGITDTTLSNWSCSVHEGFDAWPVAGFDVLAIARGIGASYTASDGSVGTPYILARGVSVISDITLAPATGTAAPGTTYTLIATINRHGTPIPGQTVTFTAIGGPNIGLTLTGGPTNASGQATASYTSAVTGTDTWVARFTEIEMGTQTSGRATVDWTKGTKAPVPTVAPRLSALKASSPGCGQLTATATFLTAGLPYQIVVTPASGGPLHVVDLTADASGSASTTVDLKSAFGTSGGTYLAYVRLGIGIKYSNTASLTVAACPVATPVPTPAPTPTPTVAPVGRVPSTIGRLPSTATGDDGLGTTALILIGLVTLGAVAWKRRPRRT